MSEPFVGEIKMFGGNFPPAGWMLCQGQLLPPELQSSHPSHGARPAALLRRKVSEASVGTRNRMKVSRTGLRSTSQK